jgi:preprotein translocase subunit SecA
VLNAKQHQREAEIVQEAGQAGTVTIATNMAGRGTDIKLGTGVKDAGGLAIIGTERHESRRVDRQLRGRAGRQGDPGSSQFFVSLEDDLMRLFGSERIARVMDRLGMKEGEVIQSGMITSSIERAQKKVEENNFGIRKRLLEYDDQMNHQREVIYKRRRNALYGDRLAIDIANMIMETCESIVGEYQDLRDFDGFKLEAIRVLSVDSAIAEEQFLKEKSDKLAQLLYEEAMKHYQHKSAHIAELAFPVIQQVYQTQSAQFENMMIPVSDGFKTLQIVVNLKRSVENKGREVTTAMERFITLAIIDDVWKEHLREMDDLKQSVQNAVYEQKDPLLVYKIESFKLFEQMLGRIARDITAFLMKGMLPTSNPDQPQAAPAPQMRPAVAPRPAPAPALRTSRSEMPQRNEEPQQEIKREPVKADPKIGRNDPCPCGSGKKYKSCHGQGVGA